MGPGDAASAHIYFPWLDAVVSRRQRAPRETAPPPPSISTSYQGLPIPAATLDSPAPVPSAPSSNLSPCPSTSSAQEPVPGYARGKCAWQVKGLFSSFLGRDPGIPATRRWRVLTPLLPGCTGSLGTRRAGGGGAQLRSSGFNSMHH